MPSLLNLGPTAATPQDPTTAFYPTTTRTQQLGKLSEQVNSQLAGEAGVQQAQRVAGLQQAVQQATQAGSRATSSQVQQMGSQQAQQQGQIALGAAQTALTRQGQIGAMGLQEQYMANQQQLVSKKQQLSQQNRQLQDQLASLNRGAKQELMDKQLQFAQDDMGRTIFNDRQMMDYQLQKAHTQEDLASYEQSVQQVSQKRMALLKASHDAIQKAMSQGSEGYNQAMDNAQKVRLTEALHAVQLKIKQESARQAGRAAMFSAAGSIVGAVAGAAVGGPAGGLAGASLGSGLGSVVAGATS